MFCETLERVSGDSVISRARGPNSKLKKLLIDSLSFICSSSGTEDSMVLTCGDGGLVDLIEDQIQAQEPDIR